ncbi:TraR/DksA family transcriptional regulator [Saccharothrix longispora]|uniref:DnaK suppressor protein n=1 Tax=Saccharothrix longispora TaxID=33920 RepID=A0ABU1PV71_9PSEU|nr:TraR/DksA C4-type zinc finger protein [Saccharothrix longispora]MDR6594178.1 DnaK suppressor protein [Saccharothrix longispora]
MTGVERGGASGGRLSDHLPGLRAELERQRRFRLEQLAGLARSSTAPAGDAARREVALAVADAARQALLDVDIALALVETGDYGRCRGCREDIPLRLLRAIPTTRWCLGCRQLLIPVDDLDPGAIPQHELAAYAASRTPRARHPRHVRGTAAGRRHHGTRRTVAAG